MRIKAIAVAATALLFFQTFSFIPAANAVAPAVPSIQTIGVGTITGGRTSVKVVVVAPAGSPTIVGYQYSTDGGSTWKECNSDDCTWTGGSSTQIIIEKMSDQNFAMAVGSTYTIALKACSGGVARSSSLGLLDCSAASTGVVYKAGTADAPATVTAASPTASSILVSWDLPANDGGAAITDYTIQYSSNSGSTWSTFSHSASTARSITVTGLTSSTAYIFRIATVNSQGTGPYSVNSSSVTTLAVVSHNDSSLNSATVKGVAVSLTGGANGSITITDSSTVTLTQIEANNTSGSGSYGSTFSALDADSATVKVVLYASDSSTSAFSSDTAYSNQAIANGSFFVIEIISGDTFSTSYYVIRVVVQAPVISTSTTISNGATNPTVTVSGNSFKSSMETTTITFSAGATGLTLNTLTYSSSTSIILNLSGTAAAGTITIAAQSGSYNPIGSASSNTLSITIDSPSSGGGGGGSAPAPVYVPKPPTISSISAPEVCSVVSQLTIRGTNLNGSTVKVDDLSAQVLSSSATEMQVTLPSAPVGTKTLTVTNSDGSATTSIKYAFADTPIFVNFTYPETYKNRDFKYTFSADEAAKYEITGQMPSGLTLNPLTGEITGAPTQEGNFVFNIVASNICGSTPLIVYMFVDKEIPAAFTCSVAFNILRSDNISDVKLANLQTCLAKTETLSPKYVDPIIFLSGGIPSYLTEEEALTHPRYLPIIEVIQKLKVNAQIYLGAFEGSLSSVQVNVYWPEPEL